MAILPIRIYGDPVLREKGRELTQSQVDDALRQFALDMGETMYANSGIGLAANQVGDLRRIFVVDVDQVSGERRRGKRPKDESRRLLRVYLNPEVIESSDEDDTYDEGCLSIPELEAPVFRPIRIKVRYRTLDWHLHEEWLDGLHARVFQHELDHLDGTMFIDHLAPEARLKLAGALNRIKKRHDDALQPSS
ncbi:peptide deformylase [bacterium]|nr:peptide deformylase [bacterium]